jgi:phage terminase large subunit GpA-like protein
MTVSEWADRRRVLDSRSSNEPGKWKTKRTPYLKDIMNAFCDPEVSTIVFVKPAQVGGTEAILNILGYIIDQDPGPVLLVYPSEQLAESIARSRITPMLEKSKALRDKWDFRRSKLLEMQFSGMAVSLTGANSPANLSSRPIRYVLFDEVDKYPRQSGKEAGPIELGTERSKTYNYNRKIFITSTPTFTDGAVWAEFQNCETQYYYFVPCPRCGNFQRLRFRQVKFPPDGTPGERAAGAFYECSHCQAKLNDADKTGMLRKGEWRAEKQGGRSKTGFHLNAIYSPWVSFRDVSFEWLKSQDDHEKRMNFINSWLAEPYEQVGMSAGADLVLAKQSRWTRGIVPDGALMITGGVDMQEDRYYYTLRAWGPNKISWNIDHGCVATAGEIQDIFDRDYFDESGGKHMVNFALFDSGFQTDFVYDFCYLHPDVFLPVKGSSASLPGKYRMSRIDKDKSVANGMELVICDGGYYKNMIFSRLRQEKGGWHVYDGCDADYAKQITSEHKIMRKNGEHSTWVWKLKTERADNHYLDCEVYAACAADIIGAFELLEAEENER